MPESRDTAPVSTKPDELRSEADSEPAQAGVEDIFSPQAEIGEGSLARVTAIFAGGTMFSLLLRTLGGFITARFVEPSVLGLFSGFALTLQYCQILQFGVINGLAREIPYYIGKGEYQKAKDQTAAGFAWMLLMTAISFAVLAVLGMKDLVFGKYELSAGWFTYAFMVAFTLLFKMYEVTYRTHSNFKQLAGIEVLRAIAGLALLVLVYYLGFYGLCIRGWMVLAIPLLLVIRFRPMRDVFPRWRFAELKQLWRVGLPIYAVVMLETGWMATSGTIVLKVMGTHGMGLMALASTISGLTALIPKAFSKVTMPRAAMNFGRGGKFMDVIRTLVKPTLILTAIMMPSVLIAIPLVAWFTRTFLPNYVEGIAAAQWSLVVAGLYSLRIVNVALTVIRRQDILFINTLIGIAVWGAMLLWLNRNEPYLASFPQAMAAGRVVYLIAGYISAVMVAKKEIARG